MKKTCKFEGFLWVFTIGILCLLLLSHTYNDIVVTTRHGINFWDILLDGDFFSFYERNVTVSGNNVYTVSQSCAYNILVYIVFAIWNLPLYLLERFAGVDVMNGIPFLVYAKLLPVAAMIATAVIVKKILKAIHVPQEQHNMLLYLYVSSTLLVSVIFIVGQYDILSLVLQLLGVYAFIKGDDKRFLVWFGLAFCFKFFAVVIFLPLLLLRYKKVIQWMKSMAVILSIWLFTKLPFWIHTYFAANTSANANEEANFTAGMLKDMLYSANLGRIMNIFVVVYFCILVWCYLQESDAEMTGRKGIWACMAAYAAFFGLMEPYPYWSVLLAPFVILSIAMAPKHFYLNTILETAGFAGLVCHNMFRCSWVYFGKTLQPMIWSRILEGTRFHADYTGSYLHYVISEMYLREGFLVVLNSVFLAAMLMLAYTTYPRNNDAEQKIPEPKEYRDIIVLRFLANSFICLLPIIAIFG